MSKIFPNMLTRFWFFCSLQLVQVIRVKWQLHAREEILFELANHLKGSSTQAILAAIRHSTREMIAEQEAVRDRIFTVQDAMQNAVRSVLQVFSSICVLILFSTVGIC